MRILVKTKDMDRSEWLRWRTKGIGGSDASVIWGCNRFRSIFQLWEEKTGKAEPEESSSEAAYFGSILEDIVKKEFTARTGLKVRAKNAILQSDEYPFMLADLDGIVYEEAGPTIFEAKTAIEYKESDWQEGVPFEYILQVNHYFAVTGYKKAYVAALVGGNKFHIHTVYRDETLITEIIAREKHFWEQNVLKYIKPIADGSQATTKYLNAIYAEAVSDSIELPKHSLELLDEYDHLCSIIDRLTVEKESVVNRIKSYLKENEVGYIEDRKVSWKQITKRGFDQKRLQRELPEIYDDYITQTTYRRFQVA